jgi:hypothetical protein
MATVCRHTTVADEERLTKFLTHVFATDPRADFVSPSMLRWKYWDPREDCPEPRSFVMERDGRIIAHVGLWPVTVRTHAKNERGFHAMDWAADPQSLGAGVSLFMRLTKSYDFVYGMGGSEMTRSILPRLGFRKVAEALTWSRPLRPWRQMLKHQSKDLRLPLRLARNIWWSRIPPRLVPRVWAAVELGLGSVGWPAALSGERGETFFRYLQQCPVAPCLTFQIASEGRTVGFFALSVVGEQARLAGVWLENPSPDLWKIAFQLAQQAALKYTDTSELIARSTTEAIAIAAGQAGMRVRERTPVVLFRKDGCAEPLLLQCHLCDSDSIFLAWDLTGFLT